MRSNDRRPGNRGTEAAGESFRSDTQSIPPQADKLWCHADGHGLMDVRCFRSVLDAEIRAYERGYAQALADEHAATWAACRNVVRNVVTDRSRAWAVAT